MINEETTREMISSFLRMAKKNKRQSPRETIDYATKALQLSIELGDENYIAKSYQWKGIGYFVTDEYEKALKHFLKSMELNEKLGQDESIANNLSNIGVVYATLGNYETAIEYYNSSLDIRTRLDDQNGIASSYTKLGNIYSKLGKAEEAIEHHQKALEIASEQNDTFSIGLIEHNIGYILLKTERFGDARKHLEEALQMRIKNEDTTGRIKTMTLLADTMLGLGEIGPAIEYILQAIELGKSQDAKQCLIDSFMVKAKIDAARGDYRSAYETHLKHSEYWLELHNIRNSTRIADMKNRLVNEKQQREIEMLRKDMEIVKLEKKNTALAMAVTANHEMNQPLMILRGNLDMLLLSIDQQEFSEQQKRFVERIEQAIDRIQKILDKFSDLEDFRLEDYSEGSKMVVIE